MATKHEKFFEGRGQALNHTGKDGITRGVCVLEPGTYPFKPTIKEMLIVIRGLLKVNGKRILPLIVSTYRDAEVQLEVGVKYVLQCEDEVFYFVELG